jgi:hypothetical protein
LAFKMALIASTDVANATDARIKAALSAAQSILPLKTRLDEVEFHAKLPDRSAEHLARWEKLKRENAAADAARAAKERGREREKVARASQPVAIAGSTSAITGNS